MALVALSALCLTPFGQAQSAASGAARHVVVISVAGMRASAYIALSPQARIPHPAAAEGGRQLR